MTQFKIWITIGNAAMQTGEDLARALRDVVERLECGQTDGRIRDENGNTVGMFEIS